MEEVSATPNPIPCPNPSVPHLRSSEPPRSGDTPLLVQLCRHLTTVPDTFFLIPTLTLPWCNVRPSPLILLLLPGAEADPPSPQPPFMLLQRAMKSPLKSNPCSTHISAQHPLGLPMRVHPSRCNAHRGTQIRPQLTQIAQPGGFPRAGRWHGRSGQSWRLSPWV